MKTGYAVNEMVTKARKAQAKFEDHTQNQVDEAVRVIAKTMFDNAEVLARLAVEETGMGVWEHKARKIMRRSRIIWDCSKKNKPVGIVAAVASSTDPIVSTMCSIMFALKGRNSIIILPHPKGKLCVLYTVELIKTNLKELHIPEDLIQIMEEPDEALQGHLIRSADIVISNSGVNIHDPGFTSEAENVQCIVDKGANIKKSVSKIIEGRVFDNGIACPCVQMLIVHKSDFKEIIEDFELKGAYFIDNEDERAKLRNAINSSAGQSVQKLASIAQLDIPKDKTLIIAEINRKGEEEILNRAKMCPVISITGYESFEEAVDIAQTNLKLGRKCRIACIYSDSNDHIKYAAERLPVSRLLVNQADAVMYEEYYDSCFETPRS